MKQFDNPDQIADVINNNKKCLSNEEQTPVTLIQSPLNPELSISCGQDLLNSNDVDQITNLAKINSNQITGNLDNQNHHNSHYFNTISKINQKKYGQINLNEPWNIMIKRYVKRIGEQAMGYRWAHDQEMNHYDNLNMRLKKINVVLLAIIGTFCTGDFITLVLRNDSFYLNLTLTCIQLFLIMCQAIIIGYLDLGNFQQSVFEHKLSSTKFNEIYLDILSQLTLPVDKRDRDYEYLRNKTREFNDALINSPPIRSDTFKLYAIETQNENIFKPIMVGGFDKIEIIIDDETEKQHGHDAQEEVCNNLSEKISMELDRFLKTS